MGNYKQKTKKEPVKFIPLVLAIVVILLSIGYSAESDNLSITGMVAYIRQYKLVRVTGFEYASSTNSGTSSNANFASEGVIADINLPSADSTVTYEVAVTNLGNVEECIKQITGLPSNLKYTLSGYEENMTLCDNNNNSLCKNGSVTRFQITIGYAHGGYVSGTTNYNVNINFEFDEAIYTARIGTTYYTDIQSAINAAPTDHTETTIVLLKNTYERIKICGGNNIVLDMPSLVLHNRAFVPPNSGDPVVEIFGDSKCNGTGTQVGATFKMINGTIRTEANQAAINVEPYGRFEMTGGSIISLGDRQALYVKSNGTAEISGTAYLSAKAEEASTNNGMNYRGTVHSYRGSVTILGGTIESVGGAGIAVTDEYRVTIGSKDGSVNATVPTIRGASIGLHLYDSTTLNFYDGVIKGKTTAIRNSGEIDDVETGYEVLHSGEVINGDNYDVAFLGHSGITITFDPNGGTVSEGTRSVAYGSAIGSLPIPTWSAHEFLGWFDGNDRQIQPTDTVTADDIYYAHWQDSYVAMIAETGAKYSSITAALNAVPANTQRTIQLLKNTSEKFTIASNKNIILDVGAYTLSNVDNVAVITNKGTLTLVGGTIRTTGTGAVITNNKILNITGGSILTASNNTSAINNDGASAVLTMSGGSITASGKRQAVYNSNSGTVNISGSASLSAKAEVASDNRRGTVQNLAGCTLSITGGTIVALTENSSHVGVGIAVTNLGTATIGSDDGNVSTTSPIIRGYGDGLRNEDGATLYFYDGILQARNGNALVDVGTRTIDSNSTEVTGTTTISGVTYNTWYLQSTN